MQNLLNLLSNLVQPNPKFIQDKFLRELAHKRSKAILGLQCLLITFNIFQLFQNNKPTSSVIASMAFCSLVIICLLVSCCSHPEVFNISYNLLITIYGPFHLYYDETIHFSWKGVQIYPIIVLLFTGSVYHCLIQACLQLILLKSVYEPAMINTLSFSSPDSFAKSFASSTMIFMPIVITFVISMQLTLQNAYQKISAVEKKNDEIEKQKVFLLGFSHELRNIINSIMGNVSLASLEAPSSKAQGFLTNAEFCGKMLLHLVNNILDTGKAEIGDLEINLNQTKIYNTLESIWGVCSELIKRKSLKGTITLQKNIPRVLNMDHYRLTQIFLNLVGNAVKFTDEGSIKINIEWIPGLSATDDKCFEPKPFSDDINDESDLDEGVSEKCKNVSLLRHNRLVELDLLHRKINKRLLLNPPNSSRGILKVAVSDTGIGMRESDLPKLFQKFSQVSADSAKRKIGTGLGLFISKELCNKMGGDIQVFSKSGEGTCFIFCIPMDCALDSDNKQI